MSTVPKASEQQGADNQNDSGGEYFEAPTTEANLQEVSDEHFDTPEVPDSEPTPPDASRIKPRKKPSAISGRKFRKRDLVRIDTLRPSLADRIRSDHPDLPKGARVSREELGRYRMRYMEELLQQEHGEFSELDRQVVESIAKQDTISENSEEEFEEHRTFPDRVSDNMAAFGGSWWFLISFATVLLVWIGINLFEGLNGAFDPYPFILLNLLLSCIAAIQAPVIMMSQKRQEVKDRLRSFNEYRVNLKAELEVRHLHEKLDYLISRQWTRLAEMQQMQLDAMNELAGAKKAKRAVRRRRTAKGAAGPQ
ncbi:DUF1003 domain-containing protein [Mesorhizobium sp. M00.F.Ca.ET.151.01.1.1]|uniref:DUF1003 domain-containing protein n=2 Tax=Mesorhizobium TaxID=68287 RepID=UPI000FCCA5A3|nr:MULTISPECIES: DUF1003 domain-containing protein [unclassified Mesorhizobium]RUW95798.1 DUF1003 domain-containing protein [Mesorhizobium sp. M8A.F.Ca.ET.059.01.1.1]TGR42634.1 DUF1003 domain-containing protein [bacterium M00.F.Ca.ET.199.01.1.1]TGU30196.1 DUF1003 domain-containing protein [bacterium M00.F.Ca.ET.156.01.1.1]TGU94840.1 DUF1003 domain-containing protein [Mesorhizobium sp. M00.F.Ca.ET.151.01.1.1]TGV52482.1 DUF1003 domain-containing protein [bacterium M00.F.Ca.ET.141.01.1.1]TGV8492